jgi:hypothetical protein
MLERGCYTLGRLASSESSRTYYCRLFWKVVLYRAFTSIKLGSVEFLRWNTGRYGVFRGRAVSKLLIYKALQNHVCGYEPGSRRLTLALPSETGMRVDGDHRLIL